MPIVVTPTTVTTTFADLLAEFYARGFDYLNDGANGAVRAKRWINQSYVALCARAEFPWLYADATGSAPVTITDLREVLSVTDATGPRQLQPEDRRTLIDRYVDITTAGTARYFYRDTGNQIATYPASTDTLTVRYIFRPPYLVADADRPVVPDEWVDLIVDGAVVRAKKGKDDYDQYVQQYEVDIGRMLDAELTDGAQSRFVEDTGGSGDW